MIRVVQLSDYESLFIKEFYKILAFNQHQQRCISRENILLTHSVSVLIMFNSGIQQQVFQRPKAELCFRPWWDFAEDCALSTMLAIGKKCV